MKIYMYVRSNLTRCHRNPFALIKSVCSISFYIFALITDNNYCDTITICLHNLSILEWAPDLKSLFSSRILDDSHRGTAGPHLWGALGVPSEKAGNFTILKNLIEV